MIFHFANRLFASVASFSGLYCTRLKHFGFRNARVLFGSGCSQLRVRASDVARTPVFFDGRQVRSTATFTQNQRLRLVRLESAGKESVVSMRAIGRIISSSTNRGFGYVHAISSRAFPTLAVITGRSSGRAWRRAT